MPFLSCHEYCKSAYKQQSKYSNYLKIPLIKCLNTLNSIRHIQIDKSFLFKAKCELQRLEAQLLKLQQQTQRTTVHTLNFRRTESRFNRRSFVL